MKRSLSPRRRISRKGELSEKHEGNVDGVDASHRRTAERMKGVLEPATSSSSSAGVLRAVKLASDELSPDELSALKDPAFRTQASKWRSGSGSRRVSAAFARLLNALQSIRPAWVNEAESAEQTEAGR